MPLDRKRVDDLSAEHIRDLERGQRREVSATEKQEVRDLHERMALTVEKKRARRKR